MPLIKLTGLDDEAVYINPHQITMVGLAVGQRESTIAPGTKITEIVGTLIGVPGHNIAVKEPRELVFALVNKELTPPIIHHSLGISS